MKILKIAVFVLICAGFSQAQYTDENKQKTDEILTKARLAVNKTQKKQNLKSILLKTSSFVKESYKIKDESVENETNTVTEIGIEFPGKIKSKSKFDSNHIFRGERETNQSVVERILNGEFFSNKMEAFVDGKKVDLPIKYPSKQEGIDLLLSDCFVNIFPILLETVCQETGNFKYVGIAESKTAKAEIIETELSDTRSFRLFFDQATNLLLMMTETSSRSENTVDKTTYYFSDYQEKGGMLVANTVKIERNGKTFKQKTIDDLKLNPVFKPDFFEIKN